MLFSGGEHGGRFSGAIRIVATFGDCQRSPVREMRWNRRDLGVAVTLCEWRCRWREGDGAGGDARSNRWVWVLMMMKMSPDGGGG